MMHCCITCITWSQHPRTRHKMCAPQKSLELSVDAEWRRSNVRLLPRPYTAGYQYDGLVPFRLASEAENWPLSKRSNRYLGGITCLTLLV